MNYNEAIAYINGFQFHGFRLGLERTEAILKALGDPHRAYPVIHVAGTNGKGSVCAYLSAILMAAGYRVGRYTSPHLWSLTERFDINGQPIPEQELADAIERIKRHVEQGFELSYFEYTTAIAFKWLEERKVDIAVVETGLGGRLDATNVVMPICTIITNIDFDHMAYLGDTIEKITFEKAGIIKQGVPVVTGVQQPEALALIEDRAKSLHSPVFRLGREFSVRAENGEMEYVGLKCRLRGIKPRLAGRHQYDNAALTLAACEIMGEKGVKTGEDAMKHGIAAAVWPCRGEIISLAGGKKLLLDGAHNPNGIQALCDLLSDLKELPEESVLLFAASNEGKDKDFGAMLRGLMPFFARIHVTEPPGPRRPVAIEEWQALGLPGITYIKDWREALHACLSTQQNRFICAAGSLYLVGAVRHEVMQGQ